MPEVSVVLPTYNRRETIGRALKSVLSQEFSDLECIIIDGGSDDGTYKTVRSIADNRVRYVYTQSPRSPAIARNLGIDLASGKYIAFIDSDDVWMPMKLSCQVGHLKEMKEPAAVASSFHRVTENYARRIIADPSLSGLETYKELLRDNFITTSTLVLHRDVATQLGGFDESLSALEDWELALRISKSYEFKFIDLPLCVVPVQTDSISVDRETQAGALKQILSKNKDDYKNHPKSYAYQQYRLAMVYGELGCTEDRLHHLRQAAITDYRFLPEYITESVRKNLLR
ncbi:glycosyltransferase family 2 protein [Halobellus marinus]|uniref:glycosyltransferase family 2 protein n=1 Tax=Halobellus TaxID=1073986 RepID=UPI0028AA8229|nr:glycosyltransferase [Halobellus sp. DFY28]